MYLRGTAGHILQTCISTDGGDANYCLGFIEGVVAALRDSGRSNGEYTRVGRTMCVPNSSSTIEWRDTAVAFLQENGDKLDEDAGPLLVGALERRYPCSSVD
jgi:hypothetical protein